MSQTPAPPPPAAVRRALEENLWALWSRFGRGDGCALHEAPGALWFDTPIPTLPYNGVLRFEGGHEGDDVDRRIDAIFEHYRRRRVPFFWILHPSAGPADLDERLRARGLEEAEVCPGMAMRLDDLPETAGAPAGIEIREVRDPSEVDHVLDLVAWRWQVPSEAVRFLPGMAKEFDVGRPGGALRFWLAWRDGVPVSKAIINLDAGAAGLYGVVTRPEARGLGLARILTLEGFHAAREAGYELGVLHSSPMACSLYERIGFRPVAPFRLFAPSGDFHV
ncbi:MAG: GNAT family N-acetyltransferase [Candidatus Eiseniibacteriota bacterium]|jgi:ribosomal protein S18 acetylase RimI-like enzyme